MKRRNDMMMQPIRMSHSVRELGPTAQQMHSEPPRPAPYSSNPAPYYGVQAFWIEVGDMTRAVLDAVCKVSIIMRCF
jgi:hypothetical protein